MKVQPDRFKPNSTSYGLEEVPGMCKLLLFKQQHAALAILVNHKVSSLFFRAFPTLPTFSFFTWRKPKRYFSICKDLDSFHSKFPTFLFDCKPDWFYSWLRKCYFSGTFSFCLIKTQYTCKNKMLSGLNLPTFTQFTSQLTILKTNLLCFRNVDVFCLRYPFSYNMIIN